MHNLSSLRFSSSDRPPSLTLLCILDETTTSPQEPLKAVGPVELVLWDINRCSNPTLLDMVLIQSHLLKRPLEVHGY